MRDVSIRQIALDEAGRLTVIPDVEPTEDFEQIYRAAMGVYWNPALRGLRGPQLKPDGWSHADWFRQILRAAASEYGVALALTPQTNWSVTTDIRQAIERVYLTIEY